MILYLLYTLSSPHFSFFFLNDPAPTEFSPLPLHAPLPILPGPPVPLARPPQAAGSVARGAPPAVLRHRGDGGYRAAPVLGGQVVGVIRRRHAGGDDGQVRNCGANSPVIVAVEEGDRHRKRCLHR